MKLTLWFDDYADAHEAHAAVSNSRGVKTVRHSAGRESVEFEDGTLIRFKTKTGSTK